MAATSTHLPEVAGGIESINGEGIVNTGLRNIRTVSCVLQASNLVSNEEGKVCWYPYQWDSPGPKRIVIRVEKTGTNDSVLGDSAINVAWLALGD